MENRSRILLLLGLLQGNLFIIFSINTAGYGYFFIQYLLFPFSSETASGFFPPLLLLLLLVWTGNVEKCFSQRWKKARGRQQQLCIFNISCCYFYSKVLHNATGIGAVSEAWRQKAWRTHIVWSRFKLQRKELGLWTKYNTSDTMNISA